MKQVIFGGVWELLSTSENYYASLMGTSINWDSFEIRHRGVVSTSGKIKNLRVKLDGAPGADKSYDFTLMLNGAPTALTLEIADTDTSGANTVNEIDVVAGDTISLLCDPTSSPTARYATWTSMFEGDTEKESLILGGLPGYRLDIAITEYSQPGYCFGAPTNVEDNFRGVCPTSGTIKNLYVELDADPGSGGDAYRFTLRLNGATVGESLIVTITEPDKTGFDVAHNLAVVAGDILTMMIEPISTPSAMPYAHWGMTFVADIDGESIILGGVNDTPRNYSDELNTLHSGGRTWRSVAQEERVIQLGQSCTLKKLYMLLSAAPGGGKSYTFTVRVAESDSNVVATVADAATTGNSGALEDTVADDDYIAFKSSPDGTPAEPAVYWGVVSYIAPPVPQTVGGGSVGITGILGWKFVQVVGDGSVSISGTLGRLVKLAVGSGSIAISGVLGRLIKIGVGDGAVTMSGVLSSTLIFLQNVGQGAVTISGSLGRLIKIGVGGGAVTISGWLSASAKLSRLLTSFTTPRDLSDDDELRKLK